MAHKKVEINDSEYNGFSLEKFNNGSILIDASDVNIGRIQRNNRYI